MGSFFYIYFFSRGDEGRMGESQKRRRKRGKLSDGACDACNANPWNESIDHLICLVPRLPCNKRGNSGRSFLARGILGGDGRPA